MRELGPSPRGRGRQEEIAVLKTNRGTIPAWAGATPNERRGVIPDWDHPRVGGGDTQMALVSKISPGPSPRGRGRRWTRGKRSMVAGTIPAWAGATAAVTGEPLSFRDHPRVGGGDQNRPLIEHLQSGPSPRGRGRLDQRQRHAGQSGTIPAWAGATCVGVVRGRVVGDHPRVGGGDISSAMA